MVSERHGTKPILSPRRCHFEFSNVGKGQKKRISLAARHDYRWTNKEEAHAKCSEC